MVEETLMEETRSASAVLIVGDIVRFEAGGKTGSH